MKFWIVDYVDATKHGNDISISSPPKVRFFAPIFPP
jgi:hypothetical protein